MKKLFTLIVLICAVSARAQKIDSIFFNLYTDSLKKGVYNYINVVGKMSNGRYYPLMADELEFSSSAGKWDGNSLIIDSSFKRDSVVVYARLKASGTEAKPVVIYMKKNLKEGPLKTEEELLEQWRKPKRRSLTSG